MIYLDYAANAPVDNEVLDSYVEASKKYFANPNSTHKLGLEAKNKIDEATDIIKKSLGVEDYEVIYTSGASESNNMVIQGLCNRYKNKGKHIIISKLEHNSIVAPASYMQSLGFEVDMIGPNNDGIIDIEELKSMIRDDTILVSITSVDSELGIRQPIEEIGKCLKEYPNLYFHTDASQIIGKDEINLENVDLVTIAPHKFYGVNGIGLLIKRNEIGLVPIIYGGKSTTIYRSGTPVTASIISTGKAVSLAISKLNERKEYISNLNKYIIDRLKEDKDIYINSRESSILNTINFSVKGIVSTDFVNMLGDKDVFVSTKASCCPDNSPSKSVYALTNDKSLASSSIRLSISHLTKMEEIDEFFNIFYETLKEYKNGKK